MLQSWNGLLRSLHPILDHLDLPRGGFNIFCRFRRTHLTNFTDCPRELKHYWSGHSPEHVSERYIKLGQEREFRLMWAEQIGMGFELPKLGSLGNYYSSIPKGRISC